MQVKEAVELNQINKDLIDRKDWSDMEHICIYKNYIHNLCKMIKTHDDYNNDKPFINIELKYSEYPFIINKSLYYKFINYFEYIINHFINRHGSSESTFTSGRFYNKKKYVLYKKFIGFYVTPDLRKKIDKLLSIRFV